MSTSKLQEQTKNRLRILLRGYNFKENHRPDWLRNPETGYPLELDIWLPDVDIAIEVQGEQHYGFVPFFHGTIENFHKQLKRDEIKRESCKANGVHLYEVRTIEDIEGFIEDARSYCKEFAFELNRKNTSIKALSYFAAKLHREYHRPEPNKDRLAKLAGQIVSLCDMYQIPLGDIEPDFNMPKINISFGQKRIVKIQKINLNTGHVVHFSQFAVMRVQDGIVYLRKHSDKKGEQYKDLQFNLETGLEISPKKSNACWRIPEDVLSVIHPSNQ